MMRSRYQFAVVTTLLMVAAMGQTVAAVPTGGKIGDDRVSLIYNPNTGNVFLDAAGQQISTLEIISPSGYLTGIHPDCLPVPIMTHCGEELPWKLFLLRTQGMGDRDLGEVFTPGLPLHVLAAELEVNGSVLPSGSVNSAPWGPVDLGIVPEPSGMVFLGGGLLGLLRLRRNPPIQKMSRSRN
jgi:hypothetical protein